MPGGFDVNLATVAFREFHATLAQVRERGSDGILVQADVTHPEQISDMLMPSLVYVFAVASLLLLFRALPSRIGKYGRFYAHKRCSL